MELTLLFCMWYACAGTASPPERPSFGSSSVYSTSATIRWTSSSAIKYHVHCSNGYHSYARTSSSLTLRNLVPYTTYSCCVSGIDSYGITGSEDCTTFQTRTGSKYEHLHAVSLSICDLSWGRRTVAM